MIRSFTLGAVKWEVEVDNARLDDRGAYGTTFFHSSKILLQEKAQGVIRTAEAYEQTLYHEVVHAILDTLNESELSNNEKFVQQFSVLLHQFEKTKK